MTQPSPASSRIPAWLKWTAISTGAVVVLLIVAIVAYAAIDLSRNPEKYAEIRRQQQAADAAEARAEAEAAAAATAKARQQAAKPAAPPKPAAAPAPRQVTDDEKWGYHCISKGFFSPEANTAIIMQLSDGDSFDHVETIVEPVDYKDMHRVRVRFRARSNDGLMREGLAIGEMNGKDCSLGAFVIQ